MDKLKQIVFLIKSFLGERLSLEQDKTDENEIIMSIRKGIHFKGTNLWILIFAIMVASIGLNVNSTAVIIGAMLISPLMGPIMGIGLGVGIYDFDLIKRAFKNFAIASGIGILTSFVYFSLSPLSEARSELLARTFPSIYDVLIAFFGGLAGIVAGSSKEKGNVIPGVAIATALMPPLCTAGYGLATMQFNFFFGALYLYFINSVFIAFATILIVRFLKFPKKEFLDSLKEVRVKQSIYIIILVTLLPSIYLGFVMVKRTIFEQNVIRFINTEFQHPNTQLVRYDHIYQRDTSRVEVLLVGKPLGDDEINRLNIRLPQYNLKRTKLIIREASTALEVQQTDAQWELISEIIYRNEEKLLDKDFKIDSLLNVIDGFLKFRIPHTDIASEFKAQYPDVSSFGISLTPLLDFSRKKEDTLVQALIITRNRANLNEERIRNWLKARTKYDNVQLLIIQE